MSLTKFEKARIIGARALQISMGAPVIIDVPKNLIDPVDIAMLEYDNNVIPITIKR
ncbi:MAG: DNA-directed RNA polymerase subunit K [Thermoplasmataceae archaeon]|jgi:DNA-directed RNA polymerase subunit K|nr:DNA-directed RNA polymerase subunit K [Candidatus Thermoplasmatota archaeon]